MMNHQVNINPAFCTLDHQPVTLEAFEDDRSGYWSCTCGANGEVHVGSTVRPVRASTRVASTFHQHVRQATR